MGSGVFVHISPIFLCELHLFITPDLQPSYKLAKDIYMAQAKVDVIAINFNFCLHRADSNGLYEYNFIHYAVSL